MNCTFEFEGVEHHAFIRDISLTGAFLLSTFMPPHGAEISIKLQSSLLKSSMSLDAKIVRRECNYTDRGATEAFSVKFSRSSLDLVRLIGRLAQSGNK